MNETKLKDLTNNKHTWMQIAHDETNISHVLQLCNIS